MRPARAETEFAAILAPMAQRGTADSLGSFVSEVDLPLFRQKWKSSTARTNEERIHCHLAIIKDRPLRLLRREDLQRLLNEKACGGLSFSVINHLRWDLRQIFGLAMAEGFVDRNPTEFLFTPRDARRIQKR